MRTTALVSFTVLFAATALAAPIGNAQHTKPFNFKSILMCGRGYESGCPTIGPDLFLKDHTLQNRANGAKTAKVSNAAGIVNDVMSIVNAVHDTWTNIKPERRDDGDDDSDDEDEDDEDADEDDTSGALSARKYYMCGRSGFSGCPGIPKLPSILTSKQPSLFGAPAVVRRANGRKTAKVSNAAGVVSDVMSIINTVHDTWNNLKSKPAEEPVEESGALSRRFNLKGWPKYMCARGLLDARSCGMFRPDTLLQREPLSQLD